MVDYSSTSSSERSAFSPRGRATAANLAAALALLFELFVHVNQYRLEDAIEATLHAKRAIICSGTAHDDVAIFGDSKLFSVRPDVVSSALGGNVRVTNYSWPFMGIEAFDAMLLTYLQHNPAPRLLILDARPELLGMPRHINAMAEDPTSRVRAAEGIPLIPLLQTDFANGDWYMVWDRFAYAMQP